MSDQDEISRLLAEAAALTEAEPNRTQPSDTPVADGDSKAAPVPASVRKIPSRQSARNNDALGFVWFNGSLHAAAFRRQKMTKSWSCSTPIRTVAEFETVLDDALTETEFAGTETFLVLENEVFMHQADDIPVFSEGVLRSYLKNRIQRHEQEHGRVLWVMQPLITMKQEQSILLHLLPRSFYDDLHRVLLKRHLDLTRILPLIVPLQYELNRIPAEKNTTVIVAAEVGTSTSVLAGRVGGPLLFSRTILADLNREPGRVGVEVNRSLLYTKQHFENAASSIWLMAQSGSAATAEIKTKCGGGKKIESLPTTPIDWLQTTAKLSPQQPINLLSRYLKAKQRNQFIRVGFLIVVWLGLALMFSNLYHTSSEWSAEHDRLSSLRTREPELQADRDRLDLRNRTIERNQNFVNRVNNDRLPPVPSRLLGFVSGLLPESARLIEFNVRWDSEALAWAFQFSGSIEADDETAHALIAGLQSELAKSPLRVRFNENARVLVAAPLTTPGAPEIQRFNLEGVLLEK
ncbi:MAG: hypothetical protein IPP19_10820 [Verrucomicrobia bacterium]|nr:hypothetical protein [Verrucomicrobiota bacterium]